MNTDIDFQNMKLYKLILHDLINVCFENNEYIYFKFICIKKMHILLVIIADLLNKLWILAIYISISAWLFSLSVECPICLDNLWRISNLSSYLLEWFSWMPESGRKTYWFMQSLLLSFYATSFREVAWICMMWRWSSIKVFW